VSKLFTPTYGPTDGRRSSRAGWAPTGFRVGGPSYRNLQHDQLLSRKPRPRRPPTVRAPAIRKQQPLHLFRPRPGNSWLWASPTKSSGNLPAWWKEFRSANFFGQYPLLVFEKTNTNWLVVPHQSSSSGSLLPQAPPPVPCATPPAATYTLQSPETPWPGPAVATPAPKNFFGPW